MQENILIKSLNQSEIKKKSRTCNITITSRKRKRRVPAEEAGPTYLGSVWVRPSLEVDDTIGISWTCFCVFFHRPLLWIRQAGIFTQLHIRVLCGQAGCEAGMLPNQPSTAAPGGGKWRECRLTTQAFSNGKIATQRKNYINSEIKAEN